MTFSRVTLARSLAVLLVSFGLAVPTATQNTAHAAAPLTVAQAIGNQSGGTSSGATVRGYVVGQPTATSTVVRSAFPNDYAMALADPAGATSTMRMVYVQIPSTFRSTWGLQSHPELLGKQVDVTGTLASYFSHPGLTNGTAFATVSDDGGGGTDPATPVTTTTAPTA